jgi:hypothetical protein
VGSERGAANCSSARRFALATIACGYVQAHNVHIFLTSVLQKVHCEPAMFSPQNSACYAASNNYFFEEITMALATVQSKKWKNMRVTEKAAFVGKLCIFLISFGFAFPTLLND